MPDQKIHATVMPSFLRRSFGLGVLVILGFMLIYLAFRSTHMLMIWKLILVLFGLFILWAANQMRIATLRGVVLTDEALQDTDGNVLAYIRDITSVERGSFALKPSNGFSVTLTDPKPRGWAPGLWWRVGKRLGVGGVTGAPQAKFMAELLATMIPDQR